MEQQLSIKQAQIHNRKLYPFYKMFSWDLLSYYAIDFIFLTQVKNLSAASVILAVEALYTLFKFFFQLPSTIIIDKFGKRNGLIFGNTLLVIHLFFIIFCNGLPMLIFSQFISAFGFCIKSTAESSLLYDTLPNNEEGSRLFAKTDARGSSGYQFIDAIFSVLAGFLFVINPYLPLILSSIFCLFSVFLASKFQSISTLQKQGEEENITNLYQFKKYWKNLRYSIRFIFHSSRLRSLVIFYGITAGFTLSLVAYRKSLLSDLEIPPQYFGIIFAILGIVSSIFARKQHWFYLKYKNRVLGNLILRFTLSVIICGLVCILPIPSWYSIGIILIMYGIQYAIKDSYYSLGKSYLGNFSTSRLRVKIYTVKDYIENLSRFMISLFGSFLLGFTNTAYLLVIFGCLFTVVSIVLLEYMRSRVGLQPEQYKEKDIHYVDVH